jgi:hypothetical protein
MILIRVGEKKKNLEFMSFNMWLGMNQLRREVQGPACAIKVIPSLVPCYRISTASE